MPKKDPVTSTVDWQNREVNEVWNFTILFNFLISLSVFYLLSSNTVRNLVENDSFETTNSF